MRAKRFLFLTATESRAKIWYQLVVDSLFIVAPIVCGGGGGSVLGPCFVVQYFVSFYFCNHRDGEESRLLYFNCLPDVLLLLMLCVGSSLRCRRLVCSV